MQRSLRISTKMTISCIQLHLIHKIYLAAHFIPDNLSETSHDNYSNSQCSVPIGLKCNSIQK